MPENAALCCSKSWLRFNCFARQPLSEMNENAAILYAVLMSVSTWLLSVLKAVKLWKYTLDLHAGAKNEKNYVSQIKCQIQCCNSVEQWSQYIFTAWMNEWYVSWFIEWSKWGQIALNQVGNSPKIYKMQARLTSYNSALCLPLCSWSLLSIMLEWDSMLVMDSSMMLYSLCCMLSYYKSMGYRSWAHS